MLARRMADILGLEIIHLDRVHWRPGWIEPPDDEFESDLRASIASRRRWIVDGNYGSKQSITLPLADTIIWLDFPRGRCLWRVVQRVLEHSGFSRPDLPAGCPEQADWEFIKWVWRYPRDQRPKVADRLARLRPDQRVIILTNPREVKTFMQHLSTGNGSIE